MLIHRKNAVALVTRVHQDGDVKLFKRDTFKDCGGQIYLLEFTNEFDCWYDLLSQKPCLLIKAQKLDFESLWSE